MESCMSLVPLYSKEQVTSWLDAVELLNPERYENKEKVLKELIEFSVKTASEAQQNISRDQPCSSPCGCMGGPKGCSLCNCQLRHLTHTYRFHLYLHYFYPEN